MRIALLALFLSPLACASSPPEAVATPARFEVEFAESVPEAAKAPFLAAAEIWSQHLVSDVPIHVHVGFTQNGPGGFAFPHTIKDFEGAPEAATWYPSALADAIAGRDLQPGVDDMNIFFRRNKDWHFGLDGDVPADHSDFLTVALHELGHGLGMATAFWTSDGQGSYSREYWDLSFFPMTIPLPDLQGLPSIYDAFVETASGARLTDTARFGNPSAELGAALAGPLAFGGPHATEANGGTAPALSNAPSHFPDADRPLGDPDHVMTNASGDGHSSPTVGPVTLGVLADLGWRVRP